ncbi:putative Ig domain-containing protein [Novipirellula caenicola]|uniref:Dystroglycan-type cadherin-like domain-containing protein n=1 Tax=Novipirellula caenicola TaxID=1536901 RepID=A0ABP9VUB4_9BACT
MQIRLSSDKRLRRRVSRHQNKRRQLLERLEPRLLLAGGNQPPQIAAPIADLTLGAEIPFTFNLLPTTGVVFGYGSGGTDIQATDNYFASGVQFLGAWEDITFTGNTVMNDDPYRVLELTDIPSGVSPQDYVWDNNSYVSDTRRAYNYNGSVITWDQWKDRTGLDANSTLTNTVHGTVVDVRPNQYEPGRGNAVVYNWDRLDHVELDLSEVVQVGAAFEIYDVLDLKGTPVVSGVYDGNAVSVPMVDRVSPVPIGHNPVAPLVVDKEFGSFLILSEADPVPASGNEFYVSPDGTPQGNGSQSNPWDMQTAMSHPSSVSPGDTIWIMGGTYRGKFTSTLSGTADNPIYVRERPGEEVIIDLNNGTPLNAELITVGGQYTYYQGFEVFSSDLSSRTTNIPGSWPANINRGNINVKGDHVKIINWEIHDLNKGLGYWATADGGEVYGSLIYNNGWSGPDREHGQGIYAQNEDYTRVFADNILFNQFRHGIKVYGSSAASLKNSTLEGNIAFNNGAAGTEGFTGAWQYLIGGGSEAENIVVNENFAYVGKRHFVDTDANDTLTFTARQTNGQALPSWLKFYGGEGYFTGTPSHSDAGTISIQLTARDRYGATATDYFDITVNPVNQTPSLVSAIPNTTVHRNASFDFDISSYFQDAEDGSDLSYSIAPRNGGVLPNWIDIDVETGVITGTPIAAGTTAIQVTAFDSRGSFTSDIFNLTVDNQAPQMADVLVALTDQDGSVTLGDDTVYTVTVSNQGAVTAQNVVVTTTASSGWVSEASNNGSSGNGVITTEVGNLASGASKQIEIRVTTTQPGTLSLESQVTTSTTESNSRNNADSTSVFVNALPVASDDHAQLSEDRLNAISGNLLGNDQDANGNQTLSVVQVEGVTNPFGTPVAGNFGSLQWDRDGSYSYSLDLFSREVQRLTENDFLTESFQYTVSDGYETDSAVISFQINGSNDAPTADDLAFSIDGNASAVVHAVIADDIDSDDDANSLSYEWLTSPSRGQFVDLGHGQFRFDPADQFDDLLVGQQEVQTLAYQVTDRHGASTQASVAITINGKGVKQPDDGDNPTPPSETSEITYVSFSTNGVVGDIPYADEDILALNTSTGEWSLYFDGSQVGLSRWDVNAFYVQEDGNILLSLDTNSYSRELGLVRDSDILKFTPTGLGTKTAGTLEWFLDGSDVGLNPTSGDIDEIDFTPDGRLVISTVGNLHLAGETIDNEQRIVLNNGVFGADSSGDWSLYTEPSNGIQAAISVSDNTLSLAAGNPSVATSVFVATAIRNDANPLTEIEQSALDGIQHGKFTGTEVFGDKVIYMSSQSRVSVGDLNFADEDIFVHDTRTGAWRMFFDGSDMGIRSDVDAFHLLADGSVLMSFNANTKLAGLGTVAPADIVRFVPTETGDTTAGTFEMYFDGSDVGLTTYYENVDGISMNAEGSLILSTTGRFKVPGFSGTQSDLVVFNPDALGDNTAGSWQLLQNGEDLGLKTSRENITGVSVDPESNQVFVTTLGNVTASGTTATGNDVIAYSASDPANTMTLLYAGATHGITRSLDAIYVVDSVQTNADAGLRTKDEPSNFVAALASSSEVAVAARTAGIEMQSALRSFVNEAAETSKPVAPIDETGSSAIGSSSSAEQRQQASFSDTTALDPESVDVLLATLSSVQDDSSAIEAFPNLMQ